MFSFAINVVTASETTFPPAVLFPGKPLGFHLAFGGVVRMIARSILSSRLVNGLVDLRFLAESEGQCEGGTMMCLGE
jgi:hypothetical protein